MQISRSIYRNRLVLSAVLAACIALNVITASARSSQSTQPAPAGPLTIWTKFNADSPQNTQDQWLADALKEYATQSGVQVQHFTQPYDQINSKLNLAVRAGANVPDVSYVDGQQVGFFIQNGTLTDLTDYVKNAPWYKDLTPASLQGCTAPDGKILCVPTSAATTLIYYWKDGYPNGFPATTSQFMTQAKAIKDKGKFAITMKASEKFAHELTYFGLFKTFGGTIADKNGKAAWASPESVAAAQFLRDLFVNKYAPEVDLAPGFDDEEPFKRSDALAFMAGSWSYVYLNPLTAPDGTKFDQKAQSVQAAYDAGKLDFAPPLAKDGSQPVAILLDTAWAIPKGAVNVAGAKAFIDFQMTTARDTKFAVSYGALPSMQSSLSDKAFQTPYWQAVSKVMQSDAQSAPALIEYDKATTLLGDAMNKILSDPSADIAATLKSAQDEYNAGLK